MSTTSSRMAPVKAKRTPTLLSSNFGHRMPGVSRSSSVLSTGTHCFVRVTPGRSSALALLRPETLLINVDLPTFGMPSTITRSTRPIWPLAS